MRKHARSETLLSQRSFANSETLLSTICLQRVRLQRSFECARSKVWRVLEASTALEASHCRSFDPFEWVEASIHSKFFLFPPKQVDGPS